MRLTLDTFTAYIDEMIRVGTQIQQLAISYRDSMPNAGFDQPDAGGDEINSMIDTSLRMVRAAPSDDCTSDVHPRRKDRDRG